MTATKPSTRTKRPTRKAMEEEVGWAPPANLRIEIGVSRGDLFLKAETTPLEAMNVGRLLIAMARQLTSEAPDCLPVADHVPAAHQLMPGSEMWEERRRSMGFR